MAEPLYQVLDPHDVDPREAARAQLSETVLVGLSERPKRLPSQFFYDDTGSQLFAAITELEEYYPTRCEFQVFERHGHEILGRFRGRPLNLVDLGAGDGRKTAVLLEQALEMGLDVRFCPIDISESAMDGLCTSMKARFPGLPVAGLVGEYGAGLRWLSSQQGRENLVLFLGSNVGNFDRPSTRGLLRRLWSALNAGDHVLVGFDLKKDIELLLAAYNDREGLTARFNLNLLARINRELGADFDLQSFRHYATYNPLSGAMESYLVSKRAQLVHIRELGDAFEFAPWEPIHTEYSYKYLDEDIDLLCSHGGFVDAGRFYDDRRWFCDALWRVVR
ncbi:MAG: L-histidine N(alpha)-methyltransferase [Myxococcota bacterium]